MRDERWNLLTRRIRPLLVAQAAVSMALSILIITQMIFLSRVLHAVFMEGADLQGVTLPLLFLGAAILARGGALAAQQVLNQQGAIRIKSDLRRNAFDQLLNAGPARLRQERTGELTAVLTEGLEKIEAQFSRYIPRMIHVLVVSPVIALFVLTLDPVSGLLLLVTGPLIPLFMWLIGGQAERRTQRQWAALGRLSAHFLDVLQGMPTLLLCGRAQEQAAEIRTVSDRYRLTTMGVLRVAFLSGMVLELAASLSTAIVAVQMGIRLIEGHADYATGLLVLLLAPEFYLPFRQLGAEHHAAFEGRAAANRLFTLLEARPLAVPDIALPLPPAPFDLELADVHFTYPGRVQSALQDFSARFDAGKITALVGPSGAGKSTVFHLLTRFIDPQQGTIRAGSVELCRSDPKAWRVLLAVVPQHPTLFHGTVADNLRMARSDADMDMLQAATRAAEAHDFIVRLPDGYDTRIGEQGWRFSGGERQRLALARAFLKDAPVLLMDEPVSHLDPESEEQMILALERLSRGRMTIIIAHRLRTICRADRILVMDAGRVVESGTHEELSAVSGLYAQLLGRGMAS